MKKVTWIVFVVLIGLCGLGYFAIQGLQAQNRKKTGPDPNLAQVTRGDLVQQVIETGTIDAKKAVEVKSRVAGRVKQIFVQEGDRVSAGQLIAIIDPQETLLQVRQSEAQLRGAQSSVARSRIEISQRRITAQTALAKARLRVRDLEQELRAQPRLTRSTIQQAAAGLAAAQQQYQQLAEVTQPNESQSVRSDVREAEASLKNAQIEAVRQRSLLAKGYVAQREVEAADLQAELALRRLETAQQKLKTLESEHALERQQAQERVRQARAQLDQAQAGQFADGNKQRELEAARIAVREAEAGLKDVDALIQSQRQGQASADQISSVLADSRRQLAETEIRAPIAGVVTKRLIEEGELVSSLSSFSSGTPMVRIEDRTSMIVKLNINEIDVARLKVEMTSRIDIDAILNESFTGKVTKIAPSSSAVGATTPSSGTGADPVVKFAVEVTLLVTDPRIQSGMSAKCTVEPVRRNGVLRLPLEFVGSDENERPFVMLVEKPNDPQAKPVRTPVVVGVSSGAFIEIASGVQEGQTVRKPEFTGPARKSAFQMGSGGDE